ncbi:MAG: M23 family metallopeptidase, partial [Actinomycetota bacterium]
GIARADLVAVESDLARTLAEVDDLNAWQNSRSRRLYVDGGMGFYVNLILGAQDFRSFFNRLDFIRNVISDDQRRIEASLSVADDLEVSRGVASQRKEDITAKKTAIETERANIASLQREVKANKQKVATELALRQSLLAGVQADKAGYLREMSRLEVESRNISSLLRSRQAGQVFRADGLNLAWPTTGSVSSGFGYRTHPIFGDRRLHSGIDIRAPSGQAVIASQSGTVVFAGTNGGYGLTVLVDHGNALATLYAHMSGLSVSTGSRVARGARVGSVGCSGYCTGPHLHFETRVNGEPRDPMQFF